MREIAYDFHIHSCLSPCGDGDMTPYNLVNMAKLVGLDAIALTDHNSAKNCRAALKAGEEAGITVIPGMELCTAEEIHVVCLFPTLEAAEAFDRHVYPTLPPVKNKPAVFGEQLILDERDNKLGEEPLLLVTASSIRVDEVVSLVKGYGGFCYPAHIDRNAYSILSSLGDFPPDFGFSAAEITASADRAALFAEYPYVKDLLHITSSDAHYLEQIMPPEHTLAVAEASAAAVVASLAKTNG